MKIGLDLDGVIYDFVGSMREYLVSQGYFRTQLPDPDRWEIWESWYMTAENFAGHMEAGIKKGWVFKTGRAYPGAREALEALRNDGHSLHIVTARDARYEDITRAWLYRHRIPFDSLTFSADKTVAHHDVFIEDNVDNARALAEAGVKSFLMDRPWNRSTIDLSRLPDWDVVPEIVQHFDAAKAAEEFYGDAGLDRSHEQVSSSGGAKGVKPERMSLIPYAGLKQVARVYAHGEKKYAANNWRKGYPFSWSIDALERHIGEFKEGVVADPESGLNPLAHAGFHILSLLTWLEDLERYGQFDDRYRPEEAS